MSELGAQRGEVIFFGPFSLFPAQRLVERDGAPISMGSRALEILIQLAKRPGEVIDKKELIQKTWGNINVEEGNLRFHVAVLRKALGHGKSGERYVANVPGRGYCLVAPVTRANAPRTPRARSAFSTQSLPGRLETTIGRDRTIADLTRELLARRFITIVGPGGVGKTTVAISCAHNLWENFEGAVQFFDLSAIIDARLVSSMAATTLGLKNVAERPIPGLVEYLKDKRMLLVFDNCEQVIESLVELVDKLFTGAPQIHLLLTSREVLRAEGEHLYHLEPLSCPPTDLKLTADELMNFPAARLFVERARAGSMTFKVADSDAKYVAGICSGLGGLPLAIELAAGRVNAYGIQGVAALLDQGLELRWEGKRSAPSRHRSLGALLDWSNNLLPPAEQVLLRRLSIFVGAFSLGDALAVVTGNGLEPRAVLEGIASVVAKSLIAIDGDPSSVKYRLLNTTRDYFSANLAASGERDDVARRHARHFESLLDPFPVGISSETDEESIKFDDIINNVRVALEWCLVDQGEIATGVALAAKSAQFFLEKSLLSECRRWVSQAIKASNGAPIRTFYVVHLQTALATSLMLTQGKDQDVTAAFEKALELAEPVGDPSLQLSPLSGYFQFLTIMRKYGDAFRVAKASKAVAATIHDRGAEMMADWMLGVAYSNLGDLLAARQYCETAVKPVSGWHWNDHLVRAVGTDQRIAALITLSRVLWLLGSPNRAVTIARYAIKEAELLELPIMLALSVSYANHVFLWTGDWASTEEMIGRANTLAQKYSIALVQWTTSWMQGVLAIKQGRPEAGIEIIRNVLDAASRQGHTISSTSLFSALAEALAKIGRLDEALATIDHAIASIEGSSGSFDIPEMLRIRASILRLLNPADTSPAERHLLQSLQIAHERSMLGWELRAATDLARLWHAGGRLSEAHELLSPIYSRFTEGFDTHDLLEARSLLKVVKVSSSTRPVG